MGLSLLLMYTIFIEITINSGIYTIKRKMDVFARKDNKMSLQSWTTEYQRWSLMFRPQANLSEFEEGQGVQEKGHSNGRAKPERPWEPRTLTRLASAQDVSTARQVTEMFKILWLMASWELYKCEYMTGYFIYLVLMVKNLKISLKNTAQCICIYVNHHLQKHLDDKQPLGCRF